MKALVLLLLPLVAMTAFAQSPPPDPFLIGVHGFAPEFDPVHHVCHYVRGVIANPVTLDERQRFLSATHFQLARDLGANLISSIVYPDSVITAPEDNVVHQICDAASPATGDTLRVSLLDFGISNLLAGERIMLHPESNLDFGQRGDFDLVGQQLFNRIPVDSANLASPLTLPFSAIHAIKMEAGKGVVSGVVDGRKEDLSLFRAWWDSTTRKDNSASGLYIVSVTVQLQSSLVDPDSDMPLMHLDISSVDSANPIFDRNLRYTLRERHFFDSLGHLITTPIEVVLGMIELREWVNAPNTTPVTFADYRRSDNTAWDDTTLTSYAKILGRFDRDSTARVTAKWEAFDITLRYDASASATFLLDAVCLSSPRTFAMFHPDHRIFFPSTDPDPPAELAPRLTAWQHTRARFTSRIDAILTDNGRAATPFPALRFLYGPEQGLHSAHWALASVGNLLLKEHPGSRMSIFCATSYSESPEVSAAFSRRFASGYYCYPVPADYLSPVYPDSTPGSYHHQINRTDIRGFVETSRRYRNHAETRKQLGTVHPWLPFVQNHTNLYADSLGKWQSWDFDPLREPTAAELRHQCNIALAHAADGLLFYQFSSAPWITANPFWPRDTATWNSDFAAGHPFSDPNAGSIGFVDPDPTTGLPIPRRADWNGESKWDSAATYVNSFLRTVAGVIRESLIWQGAKIWSIANHADAGQNRLVNQVLSMRQDAANPIDVEDSTFVIISEFVHKQNAHDYLFVLNGRTHPTEGHRHITVKLAPDEDPTVEWRVTNILTNDVWIVRPSASPDHSVVSNGFTDYFPPGSAALYRIEPMSNEATDFSFTSGSCDSYDRSIYIEPAATLRLDDKDVLAFTSGNGLYCDGALFANKSEFRPCDFEQQWDGVVARNGGSVELEQVTIFNGSAIAGSGGSMNLDEACRIYYANCALWNIDGTLESNATESYLVGNHLIHVGTSISSLFRDHASGLSTFGATGVSVHSNAQRIRVDECVFDGFWRGAYAFGGTLLGDADGNAPADGGNNSFRTLAHGLEAVGSGWILLGALADTLQDHCERNEIILVDPYAPQVETDANSWILARNCWWEPANWGAAPASPMTYSGNVEYDPLLMTDPIPFTGSAGGSSAYGTGLSKSASTPPPPTARGQIIVAIAARNHGSVRHLVGQFLATSAAATVDVGFLAFLHQSLREARTSGMIDSLLTLCLSRTDVESKLLAADIAATDGMYVDAVQILDGYSFAGSADLLKRSLIRKALWKPRAAAGGYAEGLRAVDSLKSLQDTLLIRAMEYYPVLYSRLSPPSAPVPKLSTERLIDRTLPDGIDVWPNYPNPFTDITSFTFKLGEEMHVRLAVFDAMGREVTVVTDADYARGVHSAVLRSSGLPSGLYFYRLTTDRGVVQRKMLLMR